MRITRLLGWSSAPFACWLLACNAGPPDDQGGGGSGAGAGAPSGSSGATASAGSPASGGAGSGGVAGNGGEGGEGGAGSGEAAGAGGEGGAGSGGAAGTGGEGDAGTGGSAGGAPSRKFVGNITTSGMIRDDFLLYWDQLTPESEGRWTNVEPRRDMMEWSRLDAYYRWTRENGIPFKHSTFVWGTAASSWLVSLPLEEQAAEIEEWIQSFCERYPDVEMIDVVNEPVHHTPAYNNAIGGKGSTGHDWVIWSFRKAREHCPNATLILNDYNVLRYDTERFIDIAGKVKAAGLLDAVGAEAHGLETLPLDELRANLEKVAGIGVPIYISEYDIDLADDEAQKAVMEQQFPVFYGHPAVAGITLYGYIHGQTWRPSTGLLRDGVPRPAMTWLMAFLCR